MRISVRGKNEKLTKKEIRDIVSFSVQLLLGNRLSRNVSIVVKNEKLKKYEWGYCGPTDYSDIKPREFEILLNNSAGKRNQIYTLLHEMIHVKQYARDELRHFEDFNYKWLGKRIEVSPTAYETLPWEIEAKQSENVLYKLYLEHRAKQ